MSGPVKAVCSNRQALQQRKRRLSSPGEALGGAGENFGEAEHSSVSRAGIRCSRRNPLQFSAQLNKSIAIFGVSRSDATAESDS